MTQPQTFAGQTAREAPALPRLLAGIGESGAVGLEAHVAQHGPVAHAPRAGGGRLIDEVERAGLLGRGGASFPTAGKWRAVAAARGRPVVVVNAVEAEPASSKDATLLELVPHLVLDGAVLAARALEAGAIVVCASPGEPAALAALEQAVEERARAAHDGPLEIEVTAAPGHFVAGHETALVSYLNGGPALPLFTPPLPFAEGVARRPTLVQNAETLAHVALIARHGAHWFRELGTAAEPGSALVTLVGAVSFPGVYEIELGASLASLIGAAGGAAEPAQAALVGGYGGTWIAGAHLGGVALSNEHLAPHGAALGAGVVLLVSAEACPIAETARLGRWLAGQSARQCGPCLHGLEQLAATMSDLASGGGPARQTLGRLQHTAALVEGRGACRHPDGAVNMLLSACEVFAAELAEHARRGPCERCASASELPLPRVEVSGERRPRVRV